MRVAVLLLPLGALLARLHGGDPLATTPSDADQTPAVRYAEMVRSACEAELGRRGVAFTSVSTTDARGVLAPVRLAGTLHGVAFHSPVPERQRARSPLEIMDCRLALALDDLAATLERHDIVEVVHFSAYRPAPARRVSPGALGRRHEGGLALDAAKFVKKDGTVLDVQKDFHGRIGARTCPAPGSPTELHALACEIADQHLFNVELTPDFNWRHRNHFHLEVTPRVKWFLVH
jgi:hypothetical protein